MNWRHPFSKMTITSRYGATANRPNAHRGLDYAPPEKTFIPAVADGTIVFIGWSDCLGHVVVQRAKSCDGKLWFIGYCHLYAKPRRIKVGDRLRAGDPIQQVGNTGACSRGAHLHLTIGPKVDSVFRGATVDPEKFIDQQIKNCKNCSCPKGN